MPRVFVSYSHESPEHSAAVRRLCEALRAVNIEVVSDGYSGPPGEGWFNWSTKEIARATHVLAVCTETYRRRFHNEEIDGVGYGVSWEGRAIRQHLRECGGQTNKVIPVLLGDTAVERIPDDLGELTWARVVDDGIKDLLIIIMGYCRWPTRALGSDWLGALAMWLPKIVGEERFSGWAQTTLGARDCSEQDETSLDYSKAVVTAAQEAGKLDEVWWRLQIDRYTEHAETLEPIFAKWQATAGRDQAPPKAVPEESEAEQESEDEQEADAEHTTIVLDRTQAWQRLTESCSGARENLAFVIYGTWQQDLDLFVRRINDFFREPEECSYHDVVGVRVRHDLSRAAIAEDWERTVLEKTRAKRGSLGSALASQASRHPVLLLLGYPHPLRALGKRELAGLESFLTQTLPTALRDGRPHNPIHVVIPIEIPGEDETSAIESIQRAFECQTTNLHLQDPERLVLPDWLEIKKHIKYAFEQERLEPDEAVFAACRALYDQIKAAKRSPRLRDLGNPLHHLLYDLIDRARRGKA